MWTAETRRDNERKTPRYTRLFQAGASHGSSTPTTGSQGPNVGIIA